MSRGQHAFMEHQLMPKARRIDFLQNPVVTMTKRRRHSKKISFQYGFTESLLTKCTG